MMKKYAVIDSGIGGLSVIQELIKTNSHSYDYYADIANHPYGNKSVSQLKTITKNALKFFINKNDYAGLIIACNTISSLKEFIHTLDLSSFNNNVIDVVTPTVNYCEKIYTKDSGLNFYLLATKATIDLNFYQKSVSSQNKLRFINVPCPLIAPMVEEGILDTKLSKEIINFYLKPLKTDKKSILILGCTHYPYIINTINDSYPQVKIISSGKSLINSSTFENIVGKSKINLFLSEHKSIEQINIFTNFYNITDITEINFL